MALRLPGRVAAPAPPSVLAGWSDAPDAETAVEAVARRLGMRPLAFALVFLGAGHDRERMARALSAAFGATPVIGCTTAGEIGPRGYATDSLLALGFPAGGFALTTRLIAPLDRFRLEDGPDLAAALLASDPAGQGAPWPHAVALMLADGQARQEDVLASSIAPSLGSVPLVGGSAGDGLSFDRSFVLHGGRFHPNAALVALIRSRSPVEVFRFDHFEPSAARMVVTAADPDARLVREINAAPAAAEYARLIGCAAGDLGPFVFAAHPVVVRVDGRHYVRAIQKAEPDGALRFYSAIGEGVVLSLAERRDMAAHLDRALAGLARRRPPELILGFDCVLRRLEAEQAQDAARISAILARHGLLGFSTYGEQFGPMHLNQTLTGVAIYPREDGDG